jgi:hypothetical protein
MMKRLAMTWLVMPLLVTACGGGGGGEPMGSLPADVVAAPPTLPADTLPLKSTERVVSSTDVAGDALDPAVFEAVVVDAGFLTGREREFRGGLGDFLRVVARVLVFHDAEGADRFVGWVQAHPADLLGSAVRVDAAVPAGALLFRAKPSGCCVKETLRFLAVWRRGETVRWLYASGPGVDRRAVGGLAEELDRVR